MALNGTYLPNGYGEATGDDLVTVAPWYTSGTAYYVSSVLGDDTNPGTDKAEPLKTLAAAETAASSGDIIILAADFDETLTASQSIGTGITLVGAGRSNGRPTAKLTGNASAAFLLSIGTTNVQIRNILFPTNDQTNSFQKVVIGGEGTANNVLFKDCRFELSSTDAASCVSLTAGDNPVFEGVEWVVTGTTGDPPEEGLLINDSGGDGLIMTDCTFDAGTLGFADGIGFDNIAPETFMRIENLSLLNGADIDLGSPGSGRVNVQTSTGGARVIFTGAP